MRINSLSVQNLGSIRDVHLDGLSPLTVLVGKNGSGKTYLFTALRLLFNEFQLIGGDSAIKNDSYFWHRRITNQNITVHLDLGLTDAEFRSLASLSDFTDDEVEADIKAKGLKLGLVRQLKFGSGWTTTSLQLGSRVLVQEDRITTTNSELSTAPKANLGSWRLILFDPASTRSKISGARALVNNPTKTAFASESRFDTLVQSHGLPVSEKFRGQDPTTWATEQGFTMVPRAPELTEGKELYDAIAESEKAARARQIADAFVDRLRSVFAVIPAARDSRDDKSLRAPLLDPELAEAIRILGLSTQLDDETKWSVLTGDVEGYLAKRLHPLTEQLFANDKGMRLPLGSLGAGEQSLLALEWQLLSGSDIFAIEDPENHLHPDLAKRTFELLRKRSGQSQLLVSTHSPFMVDKAQPHANWHIYIDGDQTAAVQCKSTDDLRELLLELGVFPSDILYRDLVIFVEGGTEKEAVLPIWADKLGLNLKGNMRVGLIALGGNSRLKDNLRILLEIAQHAPVKFLVVLDSHSSGLVTEIHNKMGVPLERFILLTEHAIEDFYTPQLISEALKSLFGLEVEADKFYKKEGVSRADTIKRMLEENQKIEEGWKVAIGTYVASRMKPPDEIKAVVDRVREELGGSKG